MHKLLNPAGWKAPKGYANGVLAEGKMIFLAGIIGWDKDENFPSDNIAGQCEQALQNIVTILAEGNAAPQHLTRMTWFVKDKQAYLDSAKAIGAAYRAIIGKHFPAMTLVQVADLLESEALVEIEATAVLPQ